MTDRSTWWTRAHRGSEKRRVLDAQSLQDTNKNFMIQEQDDIQAFGDISRETLDGSDSVVYAQMAKV